MKETKTAKTNEKMKIERMKLTKKGTKKEK